jgi:hypothetical protein
VKYKGAGLIILWLYKENNKLRGWKNVFTLYIPPWAPHTYDFVILTSLTHSRKILFVVLQIGKAEDLSAPLRSSKSETVRNRTYVHYTHFAQNDRYYDLQVFSEWRLPYNCLFSSKIFLQDLVAPVVFFITPRARTTVENLVSNSISIVALRFVAVETCVFAAVT